MDRRLRAALVVLGAIAAWAVYRQRPVRLPERSGRWEPVDQ